MVVAHAVSPGKGSTAVSAMRWYELRSTPVGAKFSLYQAGTFQNQTTSLWMGAVAMDKPGVFCDARSRPMSFHVVAFTMAQVRQGALDFQRELGAVLRDAPELKVYSASPFDLDERRRAKDRFGGDIVYFFNDLAYRESRRLGLDLQFIAEIADEEVPRRRTVVVGMPESKTRA